MVVMTLQASSIYPLVVRTLNPETGLVDSELLFVKDDSILQQSFRKRFSAIGHLGFLSVQKMKCTMNFTCPRKFQPVKSFGLVDLENSVTDMNI
jgi:hypothetical protein